MKLLIWFCIGIVLGATLRPVHLGEVAAVVAGTVAFTLAVVDWRAARRARGGEGER